MFSIIRFVRSLFFDFQNIQKVYALSQNQLVEVVLVEKMMPNISSINSIEFSVMIGF